MKKQHLIENKFAQRTNFIQIWLVVSCYVLVGSRHKFKGDFAIKLKQIEGLMEDWIECQISPLVKYCQKHNQIPIPMYKYSKFLLSRLVTWHLDWFVIKLTIINHKQIKLISLFDSETNVYFATQCFVLKQGIKIKTMCPYYILKFRNTNHVRKIVDHCIQSLAVSTLNTLTVWNFIK